MNKKLILISLAMLLSFGSLLTACGGSSSTSSTPASSAPASAAETPAGRNPSTLKYAIMFTGSLGDLGFVDEGYAGMLLAQEELGISFDYAECKAPSDYEPQLRLFAESGEYELVMAHGSNTADAIEVLAKEYPEQRFCVIDGILDGYDNVSAVGARDPEQSFLSGVLSGLVTLDDRMPNANKENVLGFAIGMDSPVSRSTAAGFISGARYVNPEVEVITAFVGGYRDPGKGKEIAMMAYGRGADIVSHNAGSAILGIFQAAEEMGRYGIGTSIASANAEYSLCTSLKNIDILIKNEIKSDVDGEWISGTKKYGIKEGICDIDFTGINAEIPADLMEIVMDVRQHVIDGKVVPAYDLPEIEEWTKNNQYKK